MGDQGQERLQQAEGQQPGEEDEERAWDGSRRRVRLMKNMYCESGGCVIKYQNIGGTMTCSTKWRSDFWVVCGDACAWTEGEFFDSGTWLAPARAVVASVALAALWWH